ncbi:dihydropteroate synthase [Aquicoccus sp. SCR17]|nr:dihydropteroate synthase [Carideicomes alvinocaridis]
MPRTGPSREAGPSRRALAGSGHVWYDNVDVLGRDGVLEFLDADEVPPEMRDRLEAPRADLCGLSLDRPRVMGILNVTPDSFSDGGDHLDLGQAVRRAVAMSREADILDIGGESTRPGAAPVPLAEEIRRTVPVIRAIHEAGLKTPISIDTRNARVAAAALEAGAHMVNDVSALRHDPDMARVVAESGAPVCLMHSQGDPETMQKDPRYDNVALDVYDHLEARVEAALEAGIAREKIILDPGIGFGKTLAHNMAVLRQLSLYHALGLPVLLGASRKRFIGTIGGAETAKARMPGSLAVALHGAGQGVQVIRVHDAAETTQALKLHAALAARDEDAV